MNSEDVKDIQFFCSWSGGKDSCLALYRAVQAGGKPKKLLTMFREDGERSRGHGLPGAIIQAQADAMNIPSVTHDAAWDNYEATFISALEQLKGEGIQDGVFGDIDLQYHLDWVEKVCGITSVTPHEPLWMVPRRELLEEFIEAGFKSTVTSVKQGVLDESFLGREITMETVSDMESAGIDASGEEGEYHTVVTDGPLFSAPVPVRHGNTESHGGYTFLDVTLG